MPVYEYVMHMYNITFLFMYIPFLLDLVLLCLQKKKERRLGRRKEGRKKGRNLNLLNDPETYFINNVFLSISITGENSSFSFSHSQKCNSFLFRKFCSLTFFFFPFHIFLCSIP